MNSVPKTRFVAKKAVSCQDLLDIVGASPSMQESFKGFGHAVLLTALWTAACAILNPTMVANGCLLAACILVYGALLVLRYPWHAPTAPLVASAFPIALHAFALLPPTEPESEFAIAFIIAEALPILGTAITCALSWQAEAPRRELYSLVGKSYLAAKARQFVGMWLLQAMACAEVFAIAASLAPYVIAPLGDLIIYLTQNGTIGL